MENVASFFDQRARANWNADALKNFTTLSVGVQKHIQKVYTTLCAALLVSALGVYVHILLGIGGFLTMLAFVGSAMWLRLTPPAPTEENKRLSLLMAAAFFQGCSVGSLVESVLNFDAGLVVTAFLGTTAIFACFTGAALLSKRREYLFVGGAISSALSIMMAMRLATFFVGGSAAMFNVELYGGLLVFVGYVLYDTQMIVERASRGDKDHISHALELFVDFVAIFVRILIILARNAGQRDSREKRKRDSRRR